MRKNSVKNTRVNEAVKEQISSILRDVKDPRIAPVTSVTRAAVAPDLKTCKVWISVLGDEEAKADTMAGLQSSAGYIRHMLAVTLNMRNTPELHFILDENIEYGVRMSKLIDEVMEKEKRDEDEQN